MEEKVKVNPENLPNLLQLIDPSHYQQKFLILKNNPNMKSFVIAMGKSAIPNLDTFLKFAKREQIDIQGTIAITKEWEKRDYLVYESSHPIIDERSIEAAKLLQNFIASIPENAQLVVLLSGGASALVESPCINLQSYQNFNKKLINSQLSIELINKARINYSLIKNGGLLNRLKARKVYNFIICDIPCSNWQWVSSRPTFYEKLELSQSDLQQIKKVLPNFQERQIEHQYTGKVHNILLLSQQDLAEAINKFAPGYQKIQIAHKNKSIEDVIEDYAIQEPDTKIIYFSLEEIPITVAPNKHNGLGGRNSHFVVSCALRLFYNSKFTEAQKKRLTIFSLATDGDDGNSESMGGFFDYSHFKKTSAANIQLSIDNFDTSSLLKSLHASYKGRVTEANIMDIRGVIWD